MATTLRRLFTVPAAAGLVVAGTASPSSASGRQGRVATLVVSRG